MRFLDMRLAVAHDLRPMMTIFPFYNAALFAHTLTTLVSLFFSCTGKVLNHFSAVPLNYMATFLCLCSCFYLQSKGLHFRHTDNTVQWLRAMESVGLPKVRGLHICRHADICFLFYKHVQYTDPFECAFTVITL